MGQAKDKVEEVQAVLRTHDLAQNAEFDSHRNLLRAAHASTNGNAGDIAQLSETLGLFAATYVEDRTREKNRIEGEFNRLHTKACPFSKVEPETIDAMITCAERPACKPGAAEPADSAPADKKALFFRAVAVLTPWRWPIAVACFSPVLPSVLEKAGQLFGR